MQTERAVLAILAAALVVTGCATAPPPPAPPLPPAAPPPDPAAVRLERLRCATVTIAAVGDLMLGTDYPEARLPADDGRGQLADAAPVLTAADVAFGNLEGVLLDGGEPEKRCENPAACYLFRSPTRFAQTLAEAGFTVMSLANNHARDFGEAGRSSSMAALAAAGVRHSGREGDVARWESAGVRAALIAFAPFRGAWSMLDLDAAAAAVAGLDTEHDLVIVSFHGGAEGAGAERIPFTTERYFGEDRGDVVRFAHAMVDAGADLVIGHGPHVPRALELYRERLIAYSLGNFATWYGISVEGAKGLAPILVARTDGSGRFVDGRVVSLRQQRPEGPRADPEREAWRMMARLTRADFPGGGLALDDDGGFAPVLPRPPADCPAP